MTDLQRVEIRWRDSMAQAGWVKREDIEREAVTEGYLDCLSVGYLLRDSEDSLTIVQSQNPAGQVGEPMTIPREAVTEVVALTQDSATAEATKKDA